ncbi:hypothetical protein MKX03_014825 [Papaver bracteatum]|nr:hypothetical protein MKX03_014825 [Papaver bracteatum]
MTFMNPPPSDHEDDDEIMTPPPSDRGDDDEIDVDNQDDDDTSGEDLEEDDDMYLIDQDEYDDDMYEDQKEDEMFVEGPQPKKVAPAEAVSTVENQDPESSKFIWKINNFSRLKYKERHYSGVFTVGTYQWRVIMFPQGNNTDRLSMYLQVADWANLSYGWSRCAQFSLAVVNQIHDKDTVRRYAPEHQFNARFSDTGFKLFMPLREFYDPGRGYLVDDTCIVEAEVKINENYLNYDSRKETGFVGLTNQGATCYLNSLLQTLYHIPYFRKAVYNMPTTENDFTTGSSIPLALQSLFYKLQCDKNNVSTKELTKSFGWNTQESFMQRDVQELNRVLCEKLEDKMKGTAVEGTIQHMFEGHHMNYIECINVDYKSTRKESFYDLQLDVKGCKDVYASFDKYVEVERLEGDNKYHADQQHGLQDAKKGVLFTDFPPVLQLQLKRYEYDVMRDTMAKINDQYEFPLQLDLDREDGKYLSPDADRSVRNLYTLHSVLVHSGGGNRGHYYAFIRPTLSEQWFKFNDERVTKEDTMWALEEQYGGEARYSNAYMLVYIRESDRDEIICNVDEKDIAEHLRIRFNKEQEEKEAEELKKKEEAEARLYTIIKIARNEDFSKQIGRDICFDLVDHEKVCSFRIHKQMRFNLFKEKIAKEFGVPVQFQRFWVWAERRDHSYRPARPLMLQEETQFVGHLSQFSFKTACHAELKLFLEIEVGTELHPIPPPRYSPKEDILLFFKLYDAEKEEIRYAGRLFVKGNGKPFEILKKLNEMAGFSPDEEIQLYKELGSESTVMCKPIDMTLTFCASQLINGDIICFQKLPDDSKTTCRYPNVPSFLKAVHNQQIVHFRSLKKPMEDDFFLELSKVLTYDEVAERVARHLGLDDPTKVRFTANNPYSQQPISDAIKYRGVNHLSEMLTHYHRTSDILYYEVLDIPLPELEGLKTLEVAFHHATKDDVVVHSIRLPKQSTVGDLINDLKTKVELSHPNAELRLLEIVHHRILKIFRLSEKIENINDIYFRNLTLRAEEILEEEKNLGPQDRLIHVSHFTKGAYLGAYMEQRFGEPFFLAVHEGETLDAVKLRVQKKLQIPDEEFAKWKFAILSSGQREYLQDSDIVSTRFQGKDFYGAWAQYLGMEHYDSSPKADQNSHTFDKPSNNLQLG